MGQDSRSPSACDAVLHPEGHSEEWSRVKVPVLHARVLITVALCSFLFTHPPPCFESVLQVCFVRNVTLAALKSLVVFKQPAQEGGAKSAGGVIMVESESEESKEVPAGSHQADEQATAPLPAGPLAGRPTAALSPSAASRPVEQRDRARAAGVLADLACPLEVEGVASGADVSDDELEMGVRSCTMDRRPLIPYKLHPPAGFDEFNLARGVPVLPEMQDDLATAKRQQQKKKARPAPAPAKEGKRPSVQFMIPRLLA